MAKNVLFSLSFGLFTTEHIAMHRYEWLMPLHLSDTEKRAKFILAKERKINSANESSIRGVECGVVDNLHLSEV